MIESPGDQISKKEKERASLIMLKSRIEKLQNNILNENGGAAVAYVFLPFLACYIAAQFSDFFDSYINTSEIKFYIYIYFISIFLIFLFFEKKSDDLLKSSASEGSRIVNSHIVYSGAYFKRYGSVKKLNGDINVFLDKLNTKISILSKVLDDLYLQEMIGQEWWSSLRGVKLEDAVISLLKKKNILATGTPKSADGGIDIVVQRASNDVYLIQCKGWEGKVSVSTIRELVGVVADRKAKGLILKYYGAVISVNGFTNPALIFARQNSISCIDKISLSKLARLNSPIDAEMYFDKLIKIEGVF